jgi:putative transposase
MLDFKRRRFPKDIILTCVRWYISYSLSYRNVEEMMAERGISLDHSTLNRWVIRYAPKISEEVKRRSEYSKNRNAVEQFYSIAA